MNKFKFILLIYKKKIYFKTLYIKNISLDPKIDDNKFFDLSRDEKYMASFYKKNLILKDL
jgi:hypothetical protein